MIRTIAQILCLLLSVFSMFAAAFMPGGAGHSAGKTLPSVLESTRNDRIRIRVVNDRAGQGAQAGHVIICLRNRAGVARTKAFDIRRAGPPRYIAPPGRQVCARFAPTRQSLVFWKDGARHGLRPVLMTSLDLSTYAGAWLMLIWRRD